MGKNTGRDRWGDGMSDEDVERLVDSLVYHPPGSAVSVEIEANWREISPDFRVSPDGRQFAIRPYLLMRGRR